ncbi:hypothetical protein CLOSTMETH_01027 [[Clostridium] methylpentosum DSM 5476]|uniref:Uncharacterized protein n=1 Tax=[Clostridium] methylpentosum DSM 5476 TaxID=537013 RepID=C0EB10_9FIRM|nr:hypothetical protein CLOSTMETH_01027 [[Clostridium] methylpentosum DSM 5476]
MQFKSFDFIDGIQPLVYNKSKRTTVLIVLAEEGALLWMFWTGFFLMC